ncbi:30S ribosomal protein S16 [bacterium]|nr:30S ribosomal protein S16 [bacterium]
MAVKIRLKRMGNRHRSFYRLIATDSRSPRDGRFLEELGFYDPMKDPAIVQIDGASVRKWIERGAQLSETARSLLKRAGILVQGKLVDAAPAPAPQPAEAPTPVFPPEGAGS